MQLHLHPIRVIAAIALLFCGVAFANQAPQTVHAEIDALFKKLQVSGCQFNRNGSWYSGAQAQAHLTKKLDYLEAKSQIKTTEDFITLAASTSSSSGKPYQVRCGDAQPVESKTWLQEQLKVLRTAK
jgi:hypothetical protein